MKLLIQLCLLGTLWQNNDTTLVLHVTDGNGWHYIVPSSRPTHDTKPDKNGVLFLEANRFKAIKKVVVLKNGEDVTDRVHFFSKTEHDNFKGIAAQKYELIKFLISPSKAPECCPSAEWDDPDVFYKYSQQERTVREKLIQEGKIRFN